jgi:peptide/nickel transport system substrate-binding protein
MKVNFLALEFNSIVAKLTSTFDWDCVLIGLTGGIEPHFGRNVWHSSGHLHMWYPLQKSPSTEWEERIDRIFDKAVSELDENKRKVLYDEWQEIVSEELPLIYTVLPEVIFAVRDRFGNLYPTPYGGPFHNIEEIFIRTKELKN